MAQFHLNYVIVNVAKLCLHTIPRTERHKYRFHYYDALCHGSFWLKRGDHWNKWCMNVPDVLLGHINCYSKPESLLCNTFIFKIVVYCVLLRLNVMGQVKIINIIITSIMSLKIITFLRSCVKDAFISRCLKPAFVFTDDMCHWY